MIGRSCRLITALHRCHGNSQALQQQQQQHQYHYTAGVDTQTDTVFKSFSIRIVNLYSP